MPTADLPEKPLCKIACSNISQLPYLSFNDSQGKAKEMTDFAQEISARYPSPKEIDTILIEARQMRAQALRDGSTSLWSMFQRAMTSRPLPAKTTSA